MWDPDLSWHPVQAALKEALTSHRLTISKDVYVGIDTPEIAVERSNGEYGRKGPVRMPESPGRKHQKARQPIERNAFWILKDENLEVAVGAA